MWQTIPFDEIEWQGDGQTQAREEQVVLEPVAPVQSLDQKLNNEVLLTLPLLLEVIQLFRHPQAAGEQLVEAAHLRRDGQLAHDVEGELLEPLFKPFGIDCLEMGTGVNMLSKSYKNFSQPD